MLTPLEIATILIAAAALLGLGLFEYFNERDQRAADDRRWRR